MAWELTHSSSVGLLSMKEMPAAKAAFTDLAARCREGQGLSEVKALAFRVIETYSLVRTTSYTSKLLHNLVAQISLCLEAHKWVVLMAACWNVGPSCALLVESQLCL